MKFKMAPNSLFAILLRSPWYLSIGLALGFGLVARALLPEQYWVFGAMGALPFLGIGVFALGRQLRAPSPRRLEAVQQAVAAMSWADFSAALEKAWQRDGYSVARASGAADFALTRGGRTRLVAARRWKAARMGEDALQALHAAMTARDASECQCITLGVPSDNALRFAKQHSIHLMLAPELTLLLRDVVP